MFFSDPAEDAAPVAALRLLGLLVAALKRSHVGDNRIEKFLGMVPELLRGQVLRPRLERSGELDPFRNDGFPALVNKFGQRRGRLLFAFLHDTSPSGVRIKKGRR